MMCPPGERTCISIYRPSRVNLLAASTIEMVCGRCPKSTHWMNDSGYFVRAGDDESGGSMSRAERDEAIIAFLLFCLEMYQTEQQRKRKMH
jgi:hypothetical protein